MRVLVSAGDGIGNTIQATPCIAALRTLPHVERVDLYTFMAPPDVPEWFQVPEMVDDVSRDPRRFQGRTYDLHIIGFVSGAARCGAKRVFKAPNPIKARMQESETYFPILRELGYQGPVPSTWFRRPLRGPRKGLRLVCIGGGGKQTPRPWGPLRRYHRYQEVRDILTSWYPDVRFLVVGKDDDTTVTGENVFDFRGKGFKEAVEAIYRSTVYVGNDCGLTHVAAALGVPTVDILGATQWRRSVPPRNVIALNVQGLACQPCQVLGKVDCNHECMRDLDPRMVAAAISTVFTGVERNYESEDER